MKKVKLVQAMFTQEEIAAINTKNIKLEEEIETLKANVEFLHSCLDDRENSIEIMKEENEKQKLHIEAKDKAYAALLKDYEEIKEKNKNLKEKLEKQLGEMLFDVRS